MMTIGNMTVAMTLHHDELMHELMRMQQEQMTTDLRVAGTAATATATVWCDKTKRKTQCSNSNFAMMQCQ